MFGEHCSRRSGSVILNDMRNWTQLAETEFIDGRWRLVLPYVIIPNFSEAPERFWSRASSGGKPYSEEYWIYKIRQVIERAARFFGSTNVYFREYHQSDIDSGRFKGKQYIKITDFYDKYASGCASDLGPNDREDYIVIDVENCRTDYGKGKKYHPGVIAHEFMHVLGFMHEHQRQDRDRFIIVTPPKFPSKETLWSSQDYLIDKRGRTLTTYDPESITHYGENKFLKINSAHPKSVDMTLIGQREKLSALDVQQINLNYPVPPKNSMYRNLLYRRMNSRQIKDTLNWTEMKLDRFQRMCKGGQYYHDYDSCLRYSCSASNDYYTIKGVCLSFEGPCADRLSSHKCTWNGDRLVHCSISKPRDFCF